ncbi:unnamed protein product [Aureobasidium pullulans]|nr:unnamed protein product [Aureobasidium pullulans]
MASYLALEVRGMVLAVLEVRLSKITAETRVWKDLEDGAALIHILVKDMTNEKGASELEAALMCSNHDQHLGPPVKPKKEPIVTKDGGDDKEPRGTPEPAEIEGDGINEPIDSPFKDIKERSNETLVPEPPTSSQTKDGWPPKQISWNPYPTSTTARNPDMIENKNPKPPRPWLPPIKEVAETVADVKLTLEQWAKKLKPVAELNARTPRPLPFPYIFRRIPSEKVISIVATSSA